MIRATENPVIIDFEKIESINSYGIRKWVEMLHNHTRKSIIYRNCPVFIIDQLNIISSLLTSNVKVESMNLPYYCSSCDEEKEPVVKINTDKIKGKEFLKKANKQFKCKKCKNFLRFYDDEAGYFNFLF